MTRSLLRPIRTRRVLQSSTPPSNEATLQPPTLTPGTRQTLAAIGTLWISFAVTASANSKASKATNASTAAAPLKSLTK